MKYMLFLLVPFSLQASHKVVNPKKWFPSNEQRHEENKFKMPTKGAPQREEIKEEVKQQPKPEEINCYQPGSAIEEPMVRVGCMDVPLRVITQQALEQEKSLNSK